MDMSKYREMFLTETREHLGNMGRLLVTLEQDPADREGIDALFRSAHSINRITSYNVCYTKLLRTCSNVDRTTDRTSSAR